MELRLPTFALSSLTLNDFIVGMIFLALPQVPLTLGNHAYALHSGRHGRSGRAWAQRRHARIRDQARLSQAPSWTERLPQLIARWMRTAMTGCSAICMASS
jgi:hypothetical protein